MAKVLIMIRKKISMPVFKFRDLNRHKDEREIIGFYSIIPQLPLNLKPTQTGGKLQKIMCAVGGGSKIR